MPEKELSGIYFVSGTTAISGQQHVSHIYFFIELKHLKHFFTVLQLMTQFLCPYHLTLEYTSVHFELHFGLLKCLPLKIVFRLFLQHAIPLFRQSSRCLPYLSRPLFELLLVRLQHDYFLIESLPVGP